MSYTITIQGEPTGKGRPRFTREGRCYTPKKTSNYEELVRLIWLAKYGPATRIHGPCIALVEAYLMPPKKTTTPIPTKKPDLDNIAKIVLDSLNGLAYKDDSQVFQLTISKQWARDGRPHVTVSIIEEVAQC
jgi:Holliday junction resolvase RusA-like endonuclease